MQPRHRASSLGAAIAMAFLALGCASPAPTRPPNIVLILADDLGWRDLGVMGSGYYETPAIDSLAAAGVLFTDAYANAPICAPTRASLLTGLYPPRTGVYTVGTSARGGIRRRRLVPVPNRDDLDLQFITVAERLGERGYATAHIGKWHLGGPGATPTDQGFDVNIGGTDLGGAHDHFFPYGREIRQLPGLEQGPDGEYLADRLTDEAIAWMTDRGDQPFFLYLSHYAVHTPIQGKAEWVDRFSGKAPAGGHDNPVYAAMIASLDESVGRVLRHLDALGLAEDTLVVFLSDNGGFGPVTSMAPLRGGKGMLYEGGIRVPLIVRWPGRAPAGKRCATPVIGLDLYPTLLEAAGVAPDGGLDGLSLTAEIGRCGTLPTRPLFWHFPAYLTSDASAADGAVWRTTPVGAVRQDNLKLLEFFETSALELYDLAVDPGETRNLAADRPQDRDRLLQTMRAWRDATNAPVPTEPNPEYRESARRRRARQG